MTVYEYASVTAAIITCSIMLMTWVITHLDRKRTEARDTFFGALTAKIEALHTKLVHVDQCVDDLKVRVLADTVTKEDLRQTFNDWRIQLSGDATGLADRVFRLENQGLRGQ